MTNRLARIIDRSRVLEVQIPADSGAQALIEADIFTHGYTLQDGTHVDGIRTHHGLMLWARVNEPQKTQPHCVFRRNAVLVDRPLKKGEELTGHRLCLREQPHP